MHTLDGDPLGHWGQPQAGRRRKKQPPWWVGMDRGQPGREDREEEEGLEKRRKERKGASCRRSCDPASILGRLTPLWAESWRPDRASSKLGNILRTLARSLAFALPVPAGASGVGGRAPPAWPSPDRPCAGSPPGASSGGGWEGGLAVAAQCSAASGAQSHHAPRQSNAHPLGPRTYGGDVVCGSS